MSQVMACRRQAFSAEAVVFDGTIPLEFLRPNEVAMKGPDTEDGKATIRIESSAAKVTCAHGEVIVRDGASLLVRALDEFHRVYEVGAVAP